MTRKTSQLSNANTAHRDPELGVLQLVALERDVGDEQCDGEPVRRRSPPASVGIGGNCPSGVEWPTRSRR
jgi:hypothetical protein